jgi:hypothetical protein
MKEKESISQRIKTKGHWTNPRENIKKKEIDE